MSGAAESVKIGLGVSANATADRVTKYYTEAQSYLTGDLRGACHFGFTAEGDTFEVASAQHAMETQLGKALNLPRDSKVVDAGAGYGRVAATMAKDFGLRVTGIELIPERVEEAQRFVEEQGVSAEVEIHLGNYAHMPLEGASVDGGYHMETLCHAESVEAVLAEWMRVLRPGGRLVLLEYTTRERESLDPLHKAVGDAMIRNTGMASMWRFTPGALGKILETAGFENVSTRDITRNVWPHWRWQFDKALREHSLLSIARMILNRTLTNIPNLAGSLMIWPERRLFGYNIVTATKPAEA